jgi:diacylglycerol kinase (ATP)
MRHLWRVLKSFAFAFAGLYYLLRTQSNFYVHVMAGVCAVIVAALLGLDGAELAAVVLAVGLVLVAEAINTALEAVVDLVSPELHPLAKIAKDVGAAGVLFAAATAVAVALVLLLPRIPAALR